MPREAHTHFKQNLLSEANIIAQGGCLRISSPSGVSLEYHILECQPYLQGELGDASVIVIVAPIPTSELPNSSPSTTNVPIYSKQLLVSSFISQKQESPDNKLLFKLISPLSHLLPRPPAAPARETPVFNSRQPLSVELLLQPLSDQVSNRACNEVAVTLNTLRALRLFSGDMVYGTFLRHIDN